MIHATPPLPLPTPSPGLNVTKSPANNTRQTPWEGNSWHQTLEITKGWCGLGLQQGISSTVPAQMVLQLTSTAIGTKICESPCCHSALNLLGPDQHSCFCPEALICWETLPGHCLG